MTKEKIFHEINSAIPYIIFYEAIFLIYGAIHDVVKFFDSSMIPLYVITIVAIAILIKAGLDLKNKKRMGIILLLLFTIMYVAGFMIRPLWYGLTDAIYILMAIFVIANWKKWGTETTNKTRS